MNPTLRAATASLSLALSSFSVSCSSVGKPEASQPPTRPLSELKAETSHKIMKFTEEHSPKLPGVRKITVKDD